MFLAQFFNDLRARRVAVAQNAGQVAAAHQFIDDAIWKTRFGFGEVAPVEENRQPSHFPMSARCVLADADFASEAMGASDITVIFETDRRSLGAGPRCMAKAQPGQVWQRQRPLPQAVDIGLPTGTGLGNVAQGIGTRIAEAFRIGRPTDAKTVNDNNKSPAHVAVASGTVFRTIAPGSPAVPPTVMACRKAWWACAAFSSLAA